MARMGTLMDVQKEWTLDDLGDAHELLNEKDKQEKQAYERIRSKK